MKKGGIVAFLLAGIIMVVYGMYNAKKMNEFMETALSTTASVVKIDVEEEFDEKRYRDDQESDDKSARRRRLDKTNYIDYIYVLYLEYDIEGNKCSSNITYPTDSINVGDRIKIWYNPENTADIRIETDSKVANGLIIMGVAISVLSFTSLIVSSLRKKRN